MKTYQQKSSNGHNKIISSREHLVKFLLPSENGLYLREILSICELKRFCVYSLEYVVNVSRLLIKGLVA